MEPLSCLWLIQEGSLDMASEDVGKRGGVPTLLQLQIARRGIVTIETKSRMKKRRPQDEQRRMMTRNKALLNNTQCRVGSPVGMLPVRSVHNQGAAATDCREGGAVSSTPPLPLVLLIVHWDHREVVRYFAQLRMMVYW